MRRLNALDDLSDERASGRDAGRDLEVPLATCDGRLTELPAMPTGSSCSAPTRRGETPYHRYRPYLESTTHALDEMRQRREADEAIVVRREPDERRSRSTRVFKRE